MKVLFVCLGNICRSPSAACVFRDRAAQQGVLVTAEGAGTGAWHVGQPPDARAMGEAAVRGYNLSAERAQQVTVADFARYDLILAMDRANLKALQAIRPSDAEAELRLFLDFAPDLPLRDVPDPYYEGDFQGVLALIEQGVDGLIDAIRTGAVPGSTGRT
ncbi:MAG: low molecular weight protein-tyrosine-phosphatase [Pseudomonadota bacterium]